MNRACLCLKSMNLELTEYMILAEVPRILLRARSNPANTIKPSIFIADHAEARLTFIPTL